MTLALPAMIFNDPPQKTRADYRNLSDRQILDLIAAAQMAQECADAPEDWFRANHDLVELRAVREERGAWSLNIRVIA